MAVSFVLKEGSFVVVIFLNAKGVRIWVMVDKLSVVGPILRKKRCGGTLLN